MTTNLNKTPLALLLAALLAFTVFAAAAVGTSGTGQPLGAGVALADDDDDDSGERRISRFSGRGLRAARVAKRRVGGGKVRKVIYDADDRERYEVTVRRGAYRYEVDLSRKFKVLDVDRDRVGDDDDDDDRDDDDRDDD